MTHKTLLQHNIVVTADGPNKFYVHAIENPSFKISCYAGEVQASALRVAEQRGYARGHADCKRQVLDRLFSRPD